MQRRGLGRKQLGRDLEQDPPDPLRRLALEAEVQENPVTIRRKKCSVTLSVGVACFPGDARLSKDIIWEADKRLYQAKSKGKNRVCSG